MSILNGLVILFLVAYLQCAVDAAVWRSPLWVRGKPFQGWNGVPSSAKTRRSLSVVPNPKGSGNVLQVEYYKGQVGPSSSGVSFSAKCFPSGKTRTLSYDVFVPSGFQWQSGGKLPGFRVGNGKCSGCVDNGKANPGCFSTRIMWRAAADAEIYMYAPEQKPSFRTRSNVRFHPSCGHSLGRGTLKLRTNAWNNVRISVKLGTAGAFSDEVKMTINGKSFSMNGLQLRKSGSSLSVDGIFFATFFGGKTGAPTSNQKLYFGKFEVL